MLDFTITPPPVDTPYPTTEIVREFDGFADWPDKPFHALADLNALAGIVFLHPNYGGLDLADSDNVKIQTGNTTHIVVKTDDLPLTQPLREVGVDDKIVDAIDKPLRRIINRAYDGPRPGKPAGSPSLNNVRVKSNDDRPGFSGVRSSLKQAGANLRQLGQHRSVQRQRIAQQHDSAQPDATEDDGHD